MTAKPLPPPDLATFLARLRERGELVEIDAEVDAELETPEIHRRVIAAGGPALLFRNVKGADDPLVCNLFGTEARVNAAFGSRPRELVEELARLPIDLVPPTLGKLWEKRGLLLDAARIGLSTRRSGPVAEVVEDEYCE